MTTKQTANALRTKTQCPQGYEVRRVAGTTNLWMWESILAPEMHSRSGYTSETAAISACIEAQGEQ